MGLSQSDRATIEKARAAGTSGLGVELDDRACAYLAAVIAEDLGQIRKFPELEGMISPFFSHEDPALLLIDLEFLPLMRRLVELDRDCVTYFACLAKLHKARLKYARILKTQPIPTIDQVGPRGLLQFGQMSPRALTAFLFWRKWLYDIDNRAAQETGYLFEPIIAHAIGGVPVSAKASPIRRSEDDRKGRQVDCIRQRHAYEIKLRVTIAASGQGRWREELDFPADCRHSGYTPVLVVFDPTPNPKLAELVRAFRTQGGQVLIGKDAWAHLEEEAGTTMGLFLRKYVHEPLEALLRELPPADLPTLTLTMGSSRITVSLGSEKYAIKRIATDSGGDSDPLPDDVDDEITGP